MTRAIVLAAFGAALSISSANADDAEIKLATVTGGTITPWCMTSGFMYHPTFGPRNMQSGIKYTQTLLSSPQAVIALNNGDVNLNECVGVSSMTQGWIKGARNLVAVAVTGAKPVFALVGNKQFKTLQDLKGGTVGSAGPQTVATQSAEMILKRGANMVQDRDYKFIISGGTAASRFAALAAGKMDALATFPPFLYRVSDDGFNILGKEADYVPGYVVGAVSVNRTWAENNRATVVKMLTSMVEVGQWMKDPANKDEIIAKIADMVRMGGKGIGTDYATRLYADFVAGGGVSYNGYEDETKFTNAMDFMSDRGFLDKKDYPALHELVDYSYLNEALRGLGLPQVRLFTK